MRRLCETDGRMRAAFAFLTVILLAACSQPSPQAESRIYPPGEKVSEGSLTYDVVDTQILPRLGDNPATARLPQTRFYLVQLTISNSGNSEVPIPAMTLVDDNGRNYSELTDGSGVPDWIGIVRRVKPGETEQGNAAFDAPAKHYRLRLNDVSDPSEVAVDLPLTLKHDQLEESAAPAPNAAASSRR